MYFKRDAVTDAEVFEVLALRNVSGEVVPVGAALVWSTAKGANFGSDVTKPATGKLGLFAGIACEAIVDQERGRVQVFGWREEALVIDDAAQAIAIGDILVPVAGQWYLTRSAAGNGTSGRIHSADDVPINAVPAAAQHGIFIGIL